MFAHETPLSFIAQFFKEFYYEVVRQKERVLSGKWLEPNALGHTPTPENGTDLIVQNLENILNRQSLEANHQGGAFGVACYREAQYIMASLADETFLNFSWEGQRFWESRLLEERLFHSHVSGEKFFINLEDFLRERNPLKREMGILYLTSIGLGFQGKYRGKEAQDIFTSYRQQLFALIYHKKPHLFIRTTSPLFPKALLYTLEGRAEPRVQTNRIWAYGVIGFCLSYLVISYGVWFSSTHTAQNMTAKILADLHKKER